MRGEDARTSHNRECFELYLLTKSQRLSTRPPNHPDEYHGRTGKRGSQPSQDTTWINAIASPDCRRTDSLLRRYLKDLDTWEPEAYDVLQRVYFGDDSDPALPEYWRQQTREIQFRQRQYNDYHADDAQRIEVYRFLLHLLEDAFVFVLYRLHHENRILYWPSPDEAYAYGKSQDKKRRVAIHTYYQAKSEGATNTEARRRAIGKSNASKQAVSYWLVGRKRSPADGA